MIDARCRLACIALACIALVLARPAGAQPEAEAKPGKEAAAAEDPAVKLARLRHDVALGKLRADVAVVDAEHKRRRGEAALEKAQLTLQLAEQAVRQLADHDWPVQLREAEINCDAAKYSTEHAKAELQELEAMYQAEEFAEMTKELVLQRGRRNLELAQRREAVQEARLAAIKSEVASKESKLRGDVADAARALELAQLEAKKSALEIEIAAAEARFNVDKVAAELSKAEAGAQAAGDAPAR